MADKGETSNGFEPARHLSRVNGNDYLEVKWRLVWLRDRHPDATIKTHLEEHDVGQYAVFYAAITVPGGGVASGYGMETQGDFRDYLEKAETKAIGRALAALGFGTQFCEDHDFGAVQGRVVDTPVQRGNGRTLTDRVRRERPSASQAASRPVQGSPKPSTASQHRFLRGLAEEFGWDDATLHAEAGKAHLSDLSIKEASALIEDWSNRPKPAQQPIKQEPQKGYAQVSGLPEEPAHLSAAMDAARWRD